MNAPTSVPEPRSAGIPDGIDIVDGHVHIWPAGLVHGGQSSAEPLAATGADLVATLDASGVGLALVSAAKVFPHDAYVLGAAEALPGRILPVIGVDPRDRETIPSIGRLAALGAVAVRVNLGATPLDDPAGLDGLDTLADETSAAGLVLQWTMRLPSAHLIERVATRHPELPQVFDHLGLPVDARDLGQLARMADLAALPAVHVKLSGMYALSTEGFPYEDVWPWIEGVVAAFGPARTLWASDWPLSTESAGHADLIGLVRRLPFLDAAAVEEVLAGTARRLWPAAR